MQIFTPAYYHTFRCIASNCPDSCCHEWSVAVDPAAAAMYRNLPGPLGDRLRQVLAEEEGDTVMTIENGRCPMWRDDGLCRIQAELGHDALCQTCRDFPRLTHDYGTFQEWTLELSCPEAARLILHSPVAAPTVREFPGGDFPDYDPQDMDILLQTRRTALSLLEQDRPMNQRLAILLLYGYHAQALLDGGQACPFDPAAALDEARDFADGGDPVAALAFFKDLEILTDRWRHRLEQPLGGNWDGPYPSLARYFVERYWLQAIADYDLISRVKLTVISCLIIKLLGGDLLQTAQLYSKEIENDPDNVDALLDAAYTCPAFTDEKLLSLLLK